MKALSMLDGMAAVLDVGCGTGVRFGGNRSGDRPTLYQWYVHTIKQGLQTAITSDMTS
ncbi:MAG: hypothetical protein HYZ73_05750 [Elusimicrobia bacterium]|nr:hypothetical protein [Elusimicrobiota bacterium]